MAAGLRSPLRRLVCGVHELPFHHSVGFGCESHARASSTRRRSSGSRKLLCLARASPGRHDDVSLVHVAWLERRAHCLRLVRAESNRLARLGECSEEHPADEFGDLTIDAHIIGHFAQLLCGRVSQHRLQEWLGREHPALQKPLPALDHQPLVPQPVRRVDVAQVGLDQCVIEGLRRGRRVVGHAYLNSSEGRSGDRPRAAPPIRTPGWDCPAL